MMAFMLVFSSGMAIHPRNAPIHHTGSERPKPRRKFSVDIDSSSAQQMTRTRLLGAGSKEAIKLPTSVVTAVKEFTIPRAVSPPPSRDSSMAGSAALNMLATRLIAARNRISVNMPRFSRKKPIPARMAAAKVSFSLVTCLFSGIRMNSSSTRNATAKVMRSIRITPSKPAKAITAVAITGVKIPLRLLDSWFNPPTRW